MHHEVMAVADGGTPVCENTVDVGWVDFLVCKVEDLRDVELDVELRGGALKDEAPTTEKLESRTGKAASQRVWPAMMGEQIRAAQARVRDSANYA